MPRGPSGAYALPTGNPVAANTPIQSAWANTTLSDLAAELTNSLDRSGRGAMTAPLKLPNGATTAPALTFSGDQNTGIFAPAGDEIAVAAGGVTNFKVTASTVEVILTSVTIGGVIFSPVEWAKLTGAAFTGDLSTTGNLTVGGTLSAGTIGIPASGPTAPGLYLSGDANTGIASAGADQLSLAAGGVDILSIDATGRLLMPARKQPCFRAETSGNNPAVSSYYTSFVSEVDDTNSFDASTGIFTAPVSGWYEFSANVYARANSGTGVSYPRLVTSTAVTVTISIVISVSNESFYGQLNSGPVYLGAGSTVQLINAGTNGTVSETVCRHFAGRLIG